MQVTIATALAIFLAASGEEIVGTSLSEVVPVSGSSILASFPFGTPGCYPTDSAMGTRGQTITVSRAGTRTCNVAPAGSPAQIVTCQANEACVESSGLLVEPGRTNVALNTGSLCKAGNTADTSWTLNNATCANDSAADPSGSTSMDTVTTLNATGSANNGVRSVTSTTGPFTVSVWAAAVSGTSVQSVGGSCSAGTATASACSRSDGGACSYSQSAAEGFAYATVGTTPVRLSVTFTCSVAVTSISSWEHDGQVFSTFGVGGRFWGIQSEVGAYATSYIPTAGVAVARAADAISITNPLAATNPSTWCVEGTYAPESGRAWDVTSGSARLWLAGAEAAANSAYGSVKYFGVYDAAAAQKYLTYSAPSSAAHRMSFGNTGGVLSALQDGVPFSLSPSGTGGGVQASQGASILLGGSTLGAGYEFGGYIQNFKVSKGVCR